MDSTSFPPGPVASRFISQTQLTEAQKKREEQLKEAYARLGQEPPPSTESSDAPYDPRTLYERLKANKDAKQEEWDERMSLSNQFRGIDASESDFLNDVARERAEEERRIKLAELKELEDFRKMAEEKMLEKIQSAVPILDGEREGKKKVSATAPASSVSTSVSPPTTGSNNQAKNKAKRKRDLGLGIVRKRPAPVPPKIGAAAKAAPAPASISIPGTGKEVEEVEEPENKKPKTDVH